MKKLLCFIVVLFTSIGFSQNYWTSETDINFLVGSNTKVASFVDNNGIHIVYSRNGGIRYALVNSQGGIIKYDKVVESEGSGTDLANVVAMDSYVYAIYYKNNDIKVARSTNLGDSWNNSFSSRDLVNTGCNKILAYKEGSNIHIVWSEEREDYGYDSHYIQFTPASQSWSKYKNVTDNETDGGKEPDLTFSDDRVHVSFIKYDFVEPKTRDRVSETWQSSQSVPFYSFPFTTSLRKGKPIIANNWLNEIYCADYSSYSVSGSYIGHSYRSIAGSTWTQNEDIIYTTPNTTHLVSNTADDKIHIIYYDEEESNYVHKYISGTTISNIVATVPLYEQSSSLSSISNDLYLLRVYNPSIPGKIKFRHYDTAPLTPANFSGTTYNNHPKITWTLNNEPDISGYEIYRNISGGYVLLGTVSASTSYFC